MMKNNLFDEIIECFDAKFANEQKKQTHFEEHKDDFAKIGKNFKDADEYEKFADIESEKKIDNRSILGYTRRNGEVVKWNSGNSVYTTTTPGHVLKTCFPLRGGKSRYEELKKKDKR